MADIRTNPTMEDEGKMEKFVVISKVRSGHKREFAFALNSQNAIFSSSGRTRASKPPIGAPNTPIQGSEKKIGSESEAEKLKENSSPSDSSALSSLSESGDKEWEFEKTRKVRRQQKTAILAGGGGRGRGNGGAEVAITVVPRKLRDLLHTGLLEGLAVWYRRGVQVRPNSSGTPGVISGFGIICFCQDCKGVAEAVSPNVFEIHAGSRNKRPADYMYMGNGKTLRDVLNACLGCSIGDVEWTIRNACGLEAEKKSLYGSLPGLESSEGFPQSANEDPESCGGISDGASKAREGILESASNTLEETSRKTVAQASDRYHHKYTSKRTSFFEQAIELAAQRTASFANKDEVCSICQIEVHSIRCNGCARVFHKECVHLQEVSNDKWYCASCCYQSLKVAATNANAKAASGVLRIGSNDRHSMRLAEEQELDRGGCALCRTHDFLKEGFGRRTIMLCDQCEREFHVGCLRDYAVQDLKELPQGNWFCSSGCHKINSTLQQLIEEGEMQIPDSLQNIIEGKHAEKGSSGVKLDVKWRLLNGKMPDFDSVEQLFSDAVSIFHEQFSPIHIPDSETDLIPYMVFGKDLDDKDFQGMYCAILTVNSQVVSAGVFRVFGTDIAELPLAATAKSCEKLGYFQTLYSCIENLLGEMEVKHLSLPAANEAKPFWTNKFGFSKFPKGELAEVGRWYPLTPFHGTSMLRKVVPEIKEFSRNDLGEDDDSEDSLGCE